MTMHLEGPWLNTTGKKKGPKKWASSEAKAKAEQLAREWRDREREWAKLAPKFSTRNNTAKSSRPAEPARTAPLKSLGPKFPPGREPQQHIPSVPDTPGLVASRPADKVYTGTKIKGIGTMHKSNAVPIFTDQEAHDISKMRR
jgi:hypothetical protein